MVDPHENLTKARKLVHELVQVNMERWQQFALPYRLWLLLAFLIVPWVIWAKLADRRRMLELLLFGLIVSLIIILLDMIGYFNDFWDYPTEMFPLAPGSWAFDLSMVPVGYMLVYQYFRSWRSYLLAFLGLAFVYAFIGEPLANWLLLVIYYRWTYLYSFFLHLGVGIGVRALVEWLQGVQARGNRKHKETLRQP